MNNLLVKIININNSGYILAMLFFVPTVYAICSGNSVNFRYVHYVMALWMLVICFKNHVLLNTNNSSISRKSIQLFFTACLLTLLYSTYAQFYSFEVSGSDFSVFETLLQQMLQGNFGYATSLGFYHFSTHQNYILLLILPFYAIFKSAIFLQLVAGFVMWSAGVMLWYVAKSETNNRFFALLLVLAFYLCPGINNASQTNFHPELFYSVAFFCLYYSYRYSSTLVYVLTLLVFLSIREEAPIYILGFIYLAIKDKQYLKLTNTVFFSSLVLIINLMIIQPYFTTKSHMLEPTTLGYWSSWGTNKSQIIHTIITHPYQIMKKVFASDSGIWHVYLTVLFIPLLDMFTLLSSIPAILLLCTADARKIYHLDLYYAILLTTIIFIGLIRIKQKYATNNKLTILLIILIIVYPLIGAGWLDLKPINQEQIKNWNKLKAVIHNQYGNYPLCAHYTLYPYFSTYEFNLPNYYGFTDKTLSCVRIFTTKTRDITLDGNCKKIGDFIYCIK